MPPVLKLSNEYIELENKVLSLVPAIRRHVGFYSMSNAGHSKEAIVNFKEASHAYSELLMKQDYAVDTLKRTFLPSLSLKTLLKLPSFFWKYIGLKPETISNKILSSLSWIILFLLNLYKEEIKVLISSIFK